MKNGNPSTEKNFRLKHDILKMNAATMAEVRNYPQPPPVVHEVMIATTLLLGDEEELSRVSNPFWYLISDHHTIIVMEIRLLR